MTGDIMEIIDPNTQGCKGIVDSTNQIHDTHDCVFGGDHSKGLDPDDTCTICGKMLGDFIVEGFDPLQPKVPILIVPNGGQNNEHNA